MEKAAELVESVKNVTLGGDASPAESGPAGPRPKGEKKAKKAAKAPVDATPLEVIHLLLLQSFSLDFRGYFWLISVTF